MKRILVALALLCVEHSIHTATAQTASREQVAGTVSSVTASANQFVLKTDKGESIAVSTTDKTVILHLAPGVTDASKATRMTLGDLQNGDRLVAYYRGTPGDKTITATTLAVRTTADIGAINQAELADWKKRGIAGNVTAVDAAAKTITIKSGARPVTITTTDKTEFHRYSPDSAKAADAKPSDFAGVKVGDQVRVLGNKSADGSSDTAESIYAGEFRQLAATVVSVNAANGEMQVKDLATKKPLTIRMDSDSTLKKLDPQMAAMLARRYGAARGGQGAGSGRGEGRGQGGEGRSAGEGRGPGDGRGGRGGGGDIGGMIDRSPTIQLAELKPGDAVLILTTMGSDPSRVTCVQLLAGVDPILTAAPNSTRDLLGGWNLGGGGGGEGQQ
ncbi:MAG TPA: DUF5666 domain-containing protein [Bryobacteraceae bacterium]|jgi:hypothetical protein|nr:DUF5666 domain-containing protein [Bryobacteraceae bacterium]